MTRLPTLGGANGVAGQINSQGEVAGNVENAVLDATCAELGTPQKFEEKPVIWKNGGIHELATYPGDPDGWAFGINDKGQAVGGRLLDPNPQTGVYVSSRHALLWDKAEVTNLGNLGGSGAVGPRNIALGLNNRGQVIGVSDVQGGMTYHGYLWAKGRDMKDLRTRPGDIASVALGLNDEGAIVGASRVCASYSSGRLAAITYEDLSPREPVLGQVASHTRRIEPISKASSKAVIRRERVWDASAIAIRNPNRCLRVLVHRPSLPRLSARIGHWWLRRLKAEAGVHSTTEPVPMRHRRAQRIP